MKEYFIDTTIPMYAGGKKSIFKEDCIKIFKDIAESIIIGFTSTEVFQEIIYRFIHIKNLKKGFTIYDQLLKTGVEILPITRNTLTTIRHLAEEYQDIPPRDIFHAAVMLDNKIKIIISADKEFDKIKEIERLDPLDYKNPNLAEPEPKGIE